MKRFNKFAAAVAGLAGAGFLVYATKLTLQQAVLDPTGCLVIGMSLMMLASLIREFSK